MSEGIKIGIVMMIITGIFMFVSVTFIEPDFVISKSLSMIEEYQPEKLEETIEKIDEAKANPRYLLSFGTNLLKYIFIGLILSSISAAIYKKKEDYS